MFAYCLNNPVLYRDPCGNIALLDDIAFGAIIILSAGMVAIVMSPTMQEITYNGIRQLVDTVESITDNIAHIHTVKKKSKSLSPKGEPNSDDALKNEDGSIKQRRHYDSNGDAEFDIDYNHSDNGSHDFPHVHIWVKGSRITIPIDLWQFLGWMIEFI